MAYTRRPRLDTDYICPDCKGTGSDCRKCTGTGVLTYKQALEEAVRHLHRVRHDILDRCRVHFLDGKPPMYTVWDCDESPAGVCIYPTDGQNRTDWDSCMFCGQPEERK